MPRKLNLHAYVRFRSVARFIFILTTITWSQVSYSKVIELGCQWQSGGTSFIVVDYDKQTGHVEGEDPIIRTEITKSHIKLFLEPERWYEINRMSGEFAFLFMFKGHVEVGNWGTCTPFKQQF